MNFIAGYIVTGIAGGLCIYWGLKWWQGLIVAVLFGFGSGLYNWEAP
jgi:hypothetical protein